MIDLLPLRVSDKWGKGHYKAPRGSRQHKGVDLLCYPGTIITSLTNGIVTKIGYPYADDLSYRYVQVTYSPENSDDLKLRYFYVNPTIKLYSDVEAGDKIGVVQDLTTRYYDIGNHVHFEVLKNGKDIDPNPILKGEL